MLCKCSSFNDWKWPHRSKVTSTIVRITSGNSQGPVSWGWWMLPLFRNLLNNRILFYNNPAFLDNIYIDTYFCYRVLHRAGQTVQTTDNAQFDNRLGRVCARRDQSSEKGKLEVTSAYGTWCTLWEKLCQRMLQVNFIVNGYSCWWINEISWS